MERPLEYRSSCFSPTDKCSRTFYLPAKSLMKNESILTWPMGTRSPLTTCATRHLSHISCWTLGSLASLGKVLPPRAVPDWALLSKSSMPTLSPTPSTVLVSVWTVALVQNQAWTVKVTCVRRKPWQLFPKLVFLGKHSSLPLFTVRYQF